MLKSKVEKASVLFVLTVTLLLTAAFNASSPMIASDLEGTWEVDLRPTPDSPPYLQTMVINNVENGKFTGSFYGTTMQNGRINTAWGRLVFAFVTQDGSGYYHTTGELKDGKLSGVTHSIGRDFLSPWTGERTVHGATR